MLKVLKKTRPKTGRVTFPSSTFRSDVAEVASHPGDPSSSLPGPGLPDPRPRPPPVPAMGSTDLMPTAVRRAEAAWRPEYLGVVELGKKLTRKILEDPGPGPSSPPPSSRGPSSIARETAAEDLLAGAGELADRQDKLNKAFEELLATVSAAGGGPWEGRLHLTEETLLDWMCDQDDRVEELKEQIAKKQRELVWLTEVEEEDETPPRSRVIATAAATPQEAGIPGAGQLEAPWYQGKRGAHLQARPDRQVGGPDLIAMIQLEVGEQTAVIWMSIDEMRSCQSGLQDVIRREEATTRGPGYRAAGKSQGGRWRTLPRRHTICPRLGPRRRKKEWAGRSTSGSTSRRPTPAAGRSTPSRIPAVPPKWHCSRPSYGTGNRR